jgi:hypothetical protein
MAVTPTDFWFFQAKDAVTGVIALGGLTIALTNLYNAYLRLPRIVSTPGSWVSLASHYGDEAKFRIFLKCLFYNKGSEPALVISLKIKLIPTAGVSPFASQAIFQWHEFVSREEVKESGAFHHKGIRAVFEGEAFALVIPKTDAVEKEIVFLAESGTLMAAEYTLVLEGAFIGPGKRLRKFRSSSTRLTFEAKHFALAKDRVVRDEAGKYLYSNHVRVNSVPSWSVRT